MPLRRVRRAAGARAVLTALLVLAARSAAADGPAGGWESLERGGITVLFQEQDRTAAERALDVGAVALERLAREIGGAGTPVRIVVAPTDDEFDRLGGGVPDWGVGWADARRSFVALRSPRTVSYPLQFDAVIVHELAHVVTGRALLNAGAPRWFDEGLAMSLAGEWNGDETALAAAAVAGTLIPLSELEDGFPEPSRAAALAYAESFQAVRFLMREAGISTEADLVSAVASAAGFESALFRLSGRSASRFDRDVRSHIRRTFGWGTLLEGAGVLMLVATAAFGIAAVRRSRRSRARLRELEAEERVPAPSVPRRTGSSWT